MAVLGLMAHAPTGPAGTNLELALVALVVGVALVVVGAVVVVLVVVAVVVLVLVLALVVMLAVLLMRLRRCDDAWL